jgi:hypothetical protein
MEMKNLIALVEGKQILKEEREMILKYGRYTLELRNMPKDASGKNSGYFISNGKASCKIGNSLEIRQDMEDDFKKFVKISIALEDAPNEG